MPTENLLNPELLRVDEIVENIINHSENLTAYYSDVDRRIVKVCRDRQVLPEDIPVDESGYVTSIALTDMAVYYGVAIILRGYNGKGAGNLRDVYAKYEMYWKMYQEALDAVTKEEIEGGAPEDELINPVHQVDQTFYAVL